jgi:hypothetical protein
MSIPASYSLEFYRGDSFRRQFLLWADKDKTQPVDLTGATAAAELRPAPSAERWQSLTCSITGNVIDVSLPAADTAMIPGSGYWDLQITYASGDVRTVVHGGVSVAGDITRPAAAARARAVMHV